jgi:hypothetical protein
VSYSTLYNRNLKKYVNIRISPTNGIESPPPKLYEKNNSYREALI